MSQPASQTDNTADQIFQAIAGHIEAAPAADVASEDTITVAPKLLEGTGANFEAKLGHIDVFNLACAAKLAFRALDDATQDPEDHDAMDLAYFAVRLVDEMAEKLNAEHGTGS
jgi:hypothetical protein